MKKTVLLIDDDPDQLPLFRALIERGGYSVRTAGSGSEALEAVGQGGVDCIVCDVMMPPPSGSEFIGKVRRAGGEYHIPVVMLSASRQDMESDLLEAGADLFCLKRDALQTLVWRINQLVQAQSGD